MSSGKSKILVTAADLASQALAFLSDYDVVYAGLAPQESDLVGLMQKHDPIGVIVRYGRITANVINAGKSLKAISKHGSGIDTIDVEAAKQKGIVVCAAIGVNAAAVAEHTIALMLACAKSVPAMNARMHSGNWDKATHKSLELNGRTLGLIGLGAIGQRVALIAAAMGMKVIGYDPFVKNLPENIQLTTLDAIWEQADVISLHCPLTNDNKNLLDAQALARVKRGVIVVNTARGGLVDEQALLMAVRSGHVGVSGLYSFQQEPLPENHPFYTERNIVLTPHIGGVTTDAYVNMGLTSVRNLLGHLAL